MAEDRDELTRHFKGMRADFVSAIDGLTDSEMTAPVLDGWSVKDHLMHLAAWDELRAEEVLRISAGHETGWQMTDEQVVAFNEMVHEMRQGVSVEQAKWEIEASRARLLAAISSATARGLDGSLYGEASLRSTHETQHAAWIREYRKVLQR